MSHVVRLGQRGADPRRRLHRPRLSGPGPGPGHSSPGAAAGQLFSGRRREQAPAVDRADPADCVPGEGGGAGRRGTRHQHPAPSVSARRSSPNPTTGDESVQRPHRSAPRAMETAAGREGEGGSGQRRAAPGRAHGRRRHGREAPGGAGAHPRTAAAQRDLRRPRPRVPIRPRSSRCWRCSASTTATARARAPTGASRFREPLRRSRPPRSPMRVFAQRLDDTQSEVGRDAHRATELTLAMQRNAIFLAQQALTAPEAQALNDRRADGADRDSGEVWSGSRLGRRFQRPSRQTRAGGYRRAASDLGTRGPCRAGRRGGATRCRTAGRCGGCATGGRAASGVSADTFGSGAPSIHVRNTATRRAAAASAGRSSGSDVDRTGSLGSNVVVAADLPAAARGRWRRRILRVPRQAARVPGQVLRRERALCVGPPPPLDGACHTDVNAAASAGTSSQCDGQGTAAGRTAAEVPGALLRGHGRRDAGVDGAVGHGAGAAGRARERAEAVEVAADAGRGAGDRQNRQHAIDPHPRGIAAAALHAVQEARAAPEAGAHRRRLADGAGRPATHRRRRHRRGAASLSGDRGRHLVLRRTVSASEGAALGLEEARQRLQGRQAGLHLHRSAPALTPEGHAQLHAIRIRARREEGGRRRDRRPDRRKYHRRSRVAS